MVFRGSVRRSPSLDDVDWSFTGGVCLVMENVVGLRSHLLGNAFLPVPYS